MSVHAIASPCVGQNVAKSEGAGFVKSSLPIIVSSSVMLVLKK